ncbi:MAG: glycosyltransferase family 2 protein [Thermoguttaceae bacterium]
MAIFHKIRRAISAIRALPSLPGRLQQLAAVVGSTAQSTDALRHEMEALKNSLEVIPELKDELGLWKATLRYEMEVLKSSLKVAPELVEEFDLWKATTPIPEEPLVTVCVATYNRPHLLVARCLQSIRAQTYEKLEILVVGDGASIETCQAVKKINDSRITFFNLPERGHYPSNASRRWLVAGTAPANEALRRARGDYITHLDDDDEYLPDRIERLVGFARETKADFVWHPFWVESDRGWVVLPCDELRQGSVTTSSVFYRWWFKKIEWDVDAHMLLEPGDWNRFRRFKYFQPLMLRYPEPLLRHYPEQRSEAA